MFNFKNSNSGRIKVKLLATLLVITLTFANFALVGSYIGEVIAVEIDLTKQDNSTNDNDNVKFELYFAENNSNQISKDINAKDLVLYAKVSVENAGLLENAKIELTDTSFKLQENADEKSLNVGTLKAGETRQLELPIEIKRDGNVFNLGLLNMFSKITLTGNYTNGDEGIQINTAKYVQVNWTSEAIELIPDEDPKPIELAQELITNKIYNVGGTEKRVVQYRITSGITDNKYPIKSTTIELQAPKYDETTKQILKAEQIVEGVTAIAPEQVMVTAYSLNASNPNEILNLKQAEQLAPETTGFVYSQDEGRIDINVLNKENGNNEATWNKQGQDEFVITYIYPSDVVVEEIESIVNSKIFLHDLNNRVLSKKITNTQTITQDFGDIITFKAVANNSIYKSNMYLGEENLYATKWTTEISFTGVAENIKITDGLDKLKTAEDQEIASQAYYKNTYINKQELDYILGNQGSLKIFNSSNLDVAIAEINSQTETSEDGVITVENGNITVNYQNPIETILIEILNPANAGLLNIYNQKAIKTDTVEEIMNQIPSAKKIETTTRLFAMQGETEIVKQKTILNTIDLQEPVSDAEFGISKTALSTLNQNDVNFTITLKTDNLKYDLYENPVITITLPEVVENIQATIDDLAILNNNGLTIENLAIEDKEIIITLAGKQTAYNNTNTQISINAKVTTNKLIPTMSKEVVATVVNGKTTVYPENGEAVIKTQPINLEAQQGILLATSIANYNSSNTKLTAFGENLTGNLEAKVEEKVATVIGTVINNTKTDLEEIVIFGKVQNEGASINTALNSDILVQNKIGENTNLETEIYYTEDENPTIDSNWTNIKGANTTAYRIVLKNVNNASVIEFGYNIAIPENVDTNKETLVKYEVYSSGQTYEVPEIKLQTPKEVKLNLELTANVQNGDGVYEGQNLEYNVKITNNGETNAENVTLNIIAEGLDIYEGQILIEGLNIEAGQTVEKQIKATVNKAVTNISLTAEATTDYLLEEAKATIANTVSKPGIELEIDSTIYLNEYMEVAQLESEIKYEIKVINTLEEDVNNVQIIEELPEEVDINELYVYTILEGEVITLNLEQLEHSYNEETKELKIKIDKLKPTEELRIVIDTYVEEVIDSEIINNIYVIAEEKYPGIVFNDKDTVKVLGEPIITSSITSNVEQNLNAGDIIEYVIKVRNDGETAECIDIEDELPKELLVQNANYYYIEGEVREAAINLNEVSLNMVELKQNEEITIIIIAKAKEIQENTIIQNHVTITGIYTEQTTNKIEHTIIGTGEQLQPNPGEPGEEPGENPGNNPGDDPGGNPGDNSEQTYSISGIAWEDENKNGAREVEEKLLEEIVVKIIDANTNKYLVDEKGNEIKQVTNKDGAYQFKDLKPGKYILIYEYNKTTYSLTTYQKPEVENNLNSDARLVTEENKNIAKTDIIEIANSNISNIDIGLIVNPIFDLKLDKYITKVTVQNANGTKVYEFDKTQLAKVEIPAKVLEGSLVIVEYQIDVTNEGAVTAHVDTIVDYVSPQFEFKSELNTTWYKENDNNLYCIEFANKDLEPGKTVSTKLVLTKTMTNNNVGLVNNAAEIYETFNEYAFEDVDSIAGNKEQEDDLSQADIIISIKTGGPLLYIGIVIISMFILSAGIYLINKKVLKNYII